MNRRFAFVSKLVTKAPTTDNNSAPEHSTSTISNNETSENISSNDTKEVPNDEKIPWLTNRNTQLKDEPICHITEVIKLCPSQLVWARLEGYKEKVLYPGRICLDHGWREVPDDCELFEFFNLPLTFHTYQNVKQKFITSF